MLTGEQQTTLHDFLIAKGFEQQFVSYHNKGRNKVWNRKHTNDEYVRVVMENKSNVDIEWGIRNTTKWYWVTVRMNWTLDQDISINTHLDSIPEVKKVLLFSKAEKFKRELRKVLQIND